LSNIKMRFVKESLIRASAERVFAFHELADALQRLTPPWECSRVVQQASIAAIGSRAIIEATVFGPWKTRWIAEHTVYDRPRLFEDVQVEGPFRRWRHRHIVEGRPDGAILRDEIDYEAPLGWVGRIAARFIIERRLRRVFEYRHQVTIAWCESNQTDEE
jgi:ligand-binding SRPBCC domain-containing protein